MRILFGLTTLAAFGATAASAAPNHLSDMAYVQAARCVGLASSKTFASPDQKAMADWLRAETRGREEFIVEKADEAQRDAQIQANHADAAVKPRLQAELAGACASLRG
jgi:Skp family chaperone for outer membrane proteins